MNEITTGQSWKDHFKCITVVLEIFQSEQKFLPPLVICKNQFIKNYQYSFINTNSTRVPCSCAFYFRYDLMLSSYLGLDIPGVLIV